MKLTNDIIQYIYTFDKNLPLHFLNKTLYKIKLNREKNSISCIQNWYKNIREKEKLFDVNSPIDTLPHNFFIRTILNSIYVNSSNRINIEKKNIHSFARIYCF